MALDLAKLRKLLALDPNDPLSQFALGKKLLEEAQDSTMLSEAAEHLRFANRAGPDHLATYMALAQTLLRLGLKDEARAVIDAGSVRCSHVTEGMGKDLGPALESLRNQV